MSSVSTTATALRRNLSVQDNMVSQATPDLPDRISVVQNNENGKDKVAPGCVPVLFNNNHTSDVSGLDEVGLMETGFGPAERIEAGPTGKNTWDRESYIRLGITALVLCLAVVGALVLMQAHFRAVLLWFEEEQGIKGPIIFATMFLPVQYPIFLCGYMVLNLGAGYIYGPLHGFLITSAGTCVGTSLSFLSLRYVFKGYMHQLTQGYSNYRKLVRVIEGRSGYKIMMMTRMCPIPMGVQNALYASTNVSISRFAQTTTVGLLPTQMLNSYMGSCLRSIEDVLAGKSSSYFLYLQIFLFVGVTLFINNRMKREIDRECDTPTAVSSPAIVDRTRRSSIPAGPPTRSHRRAHSDGAILLTVDANPLQPS